MSKDKSLNDLLYDIRRVAENREVLTDKKIKSICNSLTKSLNSFVAEQYTKYADADGRLYTSYLDKARRKAWFLNEIAKEVDLIQPELRKEISSIIDDTYSLAYKGIVEATKKADTAEKLGEIAKELKVQPEVLKQAVNNNISKLTSLGVLEKNRAEIIYQIQQELNIGLMNGDRYEKMAKRIAERTGVAETRAKNIVKTETHRNIENGLMDGAEKASEDFADIDCIYAATWRTRKDQRVRPQQRRRTKNGWKTTYSNNGANHMIMEGKTVKVGELFDLGDGAKAKNPSGSGEARHDCNCRCFLEYNIMTVAEFAKATGQTEEQVRKKYNMQGGKTDGNLLEIYEKQQALIDKYGDLDKLLIYGSGDEIEQYAIYKKQLGDFKPKGVKEKTLTNTGKTDKIELPKSLEKFDDYQSDWVSKKIYMPKKKKEALEESIQKVIDNNAYSMRVNARDLESIINGGFKNQFETGTSGGTLSKEQRKKASKRLFGNGGDMKDSEFEKYGYLGSMDFAVDSASSMTGQYGKTIVKFKKGNLKDRVTYTIDDSLGNAVFNRVCGGKIGDKCSISGVPIDEIDTVSDFFEHATRADYYNADDVAQIMGMRYWELQYHGKLTIDDVESICFTKADKASDEIIKQLKEHKVKVYELKGGEVIEI